MRRRPPSLREVQGRFQAAITDPAGDRDAARWLTPDRADELARRLAVYSDGYIARMTEALAETYETIDRILGRSAFIGLVERYVARHPSAHPNLTEVGRHFASFLRDDPVSSDIPMLPDLARLERALIESYHASSERPLQVSAVAGIEPERFGTCRLRFQPHLFRIRSRWPVRSVRRHREEDDVAEHARAGGPPENTIGYRVGLDVVLRSPGDAEFKCLDALVAGASVGEALERIAPREDGPPPPVHDWFGGWMAAGLVTALIG